MLIIAAVIPQTILLKKEIPTKLSNITPKIGFNIPFKRKGILVFHHLTVCKNHNSDNEISGSLIMKKHMVVC